MPNPNVTKHFEKGNVVDVIDSFKQLNNQAARDYSPALGPLPKTDYTFLFEELTRRLMAGEPFTYEKAEDNNNIIRFKNKVYNLTEIIAYANLDHLTFTQNDLDQYAGYCQNTSIVRPENEHEEYPTEEYFEQQNKKAGGVFSDMHYGEKLALNVYSTNYYNEMNPLLRGYYNFAKKSPDQIRDVIVHSAMCGQALARAPNKTIDGTFRYESVYNADLLANRIKIAQEGGAEVVRGFISTGEEPALPFKDKVAITYTGLVGKYVGPLSRFPTEKEFLIPPTQMTYEGYVHENGVHYFHAKPVVDLNLVHEKAQESAHTGNINTSKVHALYNYLKIIDKTLKDHCSPAEYQIYKAQVDEIKAWANVKLNELGKNPSPATIAADLSVMWDKLSNVSVNALKNHARFAAYQAEIEEKRDSEKQMAVFQLSNECRIVMNELQADNSPQYGPLLAKYPNGFDEFGVSDLLKIRDEISKDLLATKKLECLVKLSEIKDHGDQLKDQNINNFIGPMNEEILRTKSVVRLEQIKEQLECKDLLQKIDATRFGPNDKQMHKFVQDTIKKMERCANLDQLKDLKEELKSTLTTLEKNKPAIDELKNIIQDFRDRSNVFSVGMKSKANRIERAIGDNVPISERAKVQDSEPVLEALASHRHKHGKVYHEDGHINEKKASGSFHQFKQKMNELKESKPVMDAPSSGVEHEVTPEPALKC
ncbi:hypothetical protein [Legionella rowbothamii]|uniref:hypothetical protein n=1 Tax=Legionella rowbothamii TaxID=96229 RepID=UPI001055F8E6|nr:hypothetical protein [Legionella rowbothamii]